MAVAMIKQKQASQIHNMSELQPLPTLHHRAPPNGPAPVSHSAEHSPAPRDVDEKRATYGSDLLTTAQLAVQLHYRSRSAVHMAVRRGQLPRPWLRWPNMVVCVDRRRAYAPSQSERGRRGRKQP
jgi:hypothetical protein